MSNHQNCIPTPVRHSCSCVTFNYCFTVLCFVLFFSVRQDPLLGASELFNSFLRKAQQVGGYFISNLHQAVVGQ